jgi:hypothetical protein
MTTDRTSNSRGVPDLPTTFEPLSARIPAVVKLTGIGRSKLYQLISEGALDVLKVGTATLITVESTSVCWTRAVCHAGSALALDLRPERRPCIHSWQRPPRDESRPE